MAEILETLGINGQLGKALLYELLGQIAKDNSANSSITDQSSPLCKSVPISPSDAIPSVEVGCMFYSHGKNSIKLQIKLLDEINVFKLCLVHTNAFLQVTYYRHGNRLGSNPSF
jgi:hypothetical protein